MRRRWRSVRLLVQRLQDELREAGRRAELRLDERQADGGSDAQKPGALRDLSGFGAVLLSPAGATADEKAERRDADHRHARGQRAQRLAAALAREQLDLQLALVQARFDREQLLVKLFHRARLHGTGAAAP